MFKKKSKEISYYPTVFAVGDEYQIMLPVKRESLMWVQVGDECYYDESNGILRSDTAIHRMCVPMAELDRVGEYTIYERRVIKRTAYSPKIEEPVSKAYKFRPVPTESPKAYHIADAHNEEERPLSAALAYGDIDFLILNGDIPNHSGTVKNFDTIFALCSEITKGEIPVVFARGNHDMRGKCAESIALYTPSHNGNTYYTFRLGGIWGMVLDTGEDKDDNNKEYGGTVCCHAFRKRETKFIESVIANENKEYNAPGVTHRLIIAHNPFSFVLKPPFNIETELFTLWSNLIRDNIKPDLFIAGHLHVMKVLKMDSTEDSLGHPCTVIVASEKNDERYAGAGFMFKKDCIEVTSSDHRGNVSLIHTEILKR